MTSLQYMTSKAKDRIAHQRHAGVKMDENVDAGYARAVMRVHLNVILSFCMAFCCKLIQSQTWLLSKCKCEIALFAFCFSLI